MPELPEVETVVSELRPKLKNKKIKAVRVLLPKMVAVGPATLSNLRKPGEKVAEEFSRVLKGQVFNTVSRRAKMIIMDLKGKYAILVHLKMTGRLYVSTPAGDSQDRWVRLRLGLDNGDVLNFSDARRFGRVYLAANLNEIAPNLGPEPLEDDFTVKVLRERLAQHHRQIKALLLDQSFVAGVGNIYADEAFTRRRRKQKLTVVGTGQTAQFAEHFHRLRSERHMSALNFAALLTIWSRIE